MKVKYGLINWQIKSLEWKKGDRQMSKNYGVSGDGEPKSLPSVTSNSPIALVTRSPFVMWETIQGSLQNMLD
jgi:hypothetical protein